MFNLNGKPLRPVYDWFKLYTRFLEQQLQRIKERAEKIAREAKFKDRPRHT